jgi:competence protein ComEA
VDATDDAEPPRRDALDRLSRSGAGPATRRRSHGSTLRWAGPGSSPRREWAARWLTDRWPIIRIAIPLGAVGLIVVAVLAWGGVKRPASPEDRLPQATPDSTVATDRAEPSVASTTAATPVPATGSTQTASTSGLPGPAGTPAPPVTVHVAGAVAVPGVVTLPAGSRVVDAVAAARGMTAQADPDRVNLAAPITDGARIFVPLVGQPDVATMPSGPDLGGPAAAATDAGAPSPTNPIDLNAATAEQLETLPGVGPATAAAIVSHREAHGRFKRPEDLLDVRGIGEAKFEALRTLVTVG